MFRLMTIGLALSLVFACSKKKDDAEKKAPDTNTAKPTTPDKKPPDKKPPPPKVDPEKQKLLDRIAKATEKGKKAAAEEYARWTPEVRAGVRALVSADYKDSKAALEAILKSPHRMPGNADRDQHRHPIETLAFFGINQDSAVLELGSGRGWYSEILGPLLADKGQYHLTGYDPHGAEDSMRTVYAKRLKMRMEIAPEFYDMATLVVIDPPEKLELGEPDSLDVVLSIREAHNWHRRGHVANYLAAIHKVLKPGGVFGMIDHDAKKDAKPDDSAKQGRLPEAWLIAEIEKAGFKLDGKSDVNRNAKDVKGFEQGVWTLPPVLALGDKDRDKYASIGESDRYTLKFVKK